MTGKYFILFIIGISICIVTSHNLPKRAGKNPPPPAGKDASKTQSQNSATELSQKDSGSQTADQTKTQTINAKEAKTECSKECRPSWLHNVTQYLGTISTNDHLICNFKTFFPECGKSSTSCARNFICCPLHCLKEVNACWQGTGMQDICIPQVVPGAWKALMGSFYLNNFLAG